MREDEAMDRELVSLTNEGEVGMLLGFKHLASLEQWEGGAHQSRHDGGFEEMLVSEAMEEFGGYGGDVRRHEREIWLINAERCLARQQVKTLDRQ